MRTSTAYALRSDVRSPRFRRDPFLRDVAFDPGGASAPRMTAPHILPSATVNASASANFGLSWLNPTPHTIAAYASQPPSPATTQHSLPGGRYSLPGPDFHRLDRSSFSWRTTVTVIPVDRSRLAGDFERRMRESGRNSVRRLRSASLTDENCEDFCVPGNRFGDAGIEPATPPV